MRGADSGRSCLARYRSISWYLVTQSISRAIRSRSPSSIAVSARSHISRTRLLIGTRPFLSVKSLARFRYSHWISRADISRPLASLTRAFGEPAPEPAGHAVAAPAVRPDGFVQRHVAQYDPRLDHAEHQVGG